MLLVTRIDEIPPIDQPCALTIGSFDGVHLGHQFLLKHLKSKLPPGGLLAAFTFSNHPSSYFTPDSPIPLIYPPLQKAKLLAEHGADIVILAPFTKEFSQTPFDQFLRRFKQKLPFTHLALGQGASFGKNREGNEENVKRLAPSLHFEVDYLPKITLHGTPLSSGRIRSLIAQAAFYDIQECLGRPYSLMGHLAAENRLYAFTAQGLCLPPEGIYAIRIKTSDQTRLGRAQVLKEKILIEPLHETASLGDKEVEIIF